MKNQEIWEKRSKKFGDSLNSVIFKNLSNEMNEHINQWHSNTINYFIRDIICQNNKNNIVHRILDVGCGYGRITKEILKINNDIQIMGVDISEHYVELYKKNTNKEAIQSDLIDLQNQNLGHFDIIICITVLMYFETSALSEVLNILNEHLNHNGYMILIENNESGYSVYNFYNYLRNIRKNRKNLQKKEVFGRIFRKNELSRMIKENNIFIIERIYTMPITTIMFPIMLFFDRIFSKKIMELMLRLLNLLNKLFGRFMLPSIYHAYKIKKSI